MKKEKRSRDKRIYVRVSINEYNSIIKRASKFPSLNEYMTHIAMKGKIVERVPSITLNHYLELNRIGNNINQIARKLNSQEANIFHRKTKKELTELFSQLTEILNENVSLIEENRIRHK